VVVPAVAADLNAVFISGAVGVLAVGLEIGVIVYAVCAVGLGIGVVCAGGVVCAVEILTVDKGVSVVIETVGAILRAGLVIRRDNLRAGEQEPKHAQEAHLP